jgi:hypothetical protein
MISAELSWLLNSRGSASTAVPPPELDGTRLAGLSHSHGLTLPMLPAAMKTATGDLRRRANLTAILGRFHTAGIPVVPLKGPVLADLLYPPGSVRVCKDLDLLVRPEQVKAALEVLRSLEYRPMVDVADPPNNPVLRLGGEMLLRSRAMLSPVDLHWKLLAWSAPCPRRLKDPWDRLKPGVWQGQPVLCLPPTELAAYLCYHGSKHLWLQLKYLFDLARLFEVGLPVDWDALLREAGEQSQTRFLLLGPLLAHRLLRAPVPKAWRTVSEHDPELNLIADYVTAALESPDKWVSHTRNRAIWAKLLETKRAAARFVCLETFGPSEADWRSVRLPEALSMLYYPYRPLRLAGVRLRKFLVQ